ncbi:MAG: gamma-glutamyltransferase [Phycisphaerae bacterium]
MKTLIPFVIFIVGSLSCATLQERHAPASTPPWLAHGETGMVASDSPHASRVGADILRAGGNAVDAAIATSFALAVTRPYSTGIGGGSFTIVSTPDGQITVQDARETAPAAAHRDMYSSPIATAPPPSRMGFQAVAVPGLLKGRRALHQRMGTLPWESLLQPAIDLADVGFPVDQHYVEATSDVLEFYERYPALKDSCGYVYHHHLREGNLRQPGDLLRQPALARTLRVIAREPETAFEQGPLATAWAKAMQDHGGLITTQDFANYKLRYREPFRFSFREYDVVTMPPPSSGGIALMETLSILDQTPYATLVHTDRITATHLQIEAMRQAFADRARWLGDADYCEIPLATLTSPLYHKDLANRVSETSRAELQNCGMAQIPDDDGTSHFCIVDGAGMAIVSTETINTSFGSLAAIDEWGLILNNEMDDFAANPGKPNAYGLMQSECNAIEPGKRPLSSMSPTIVRKNGKIALMLGGSGGPRIITSTLNVMLGVLVRGESLEEAMLAIRPHHQWQPDEIYFDRAPDAGMLQLRRFGHEISEKKKTGVVQAIHRKGNKWIGASDPRKGGRPAGY